MSIINDSSRRIIGESAPRQAVLRQVAQVLPTKATVLITGETGSRQHDASACRDEWSLYSGSPSSAQHRALRAYKRFNSPSQGGSLLPIHR